MVNSEIHVVSVLALCIKGSACCEKSVESSEISEIIVLNFMLNQEPCNYCSICQIKEIWVSVVVEFVCVCVKCIFVQFL